MERLPAELITQIVAALPRKDLFAIRQVSQYLERACFDHFARICFRKRGFFITTQSLEFLQHFSQHAGLSRHIQHVWFNPDCFTFVSRPLYTVDLDEPLRFTDYDELTRRSTSFDAYVYDHRDMLYTSRLQTMLTDIFKSLPMLKTVGMRRGEHKPYGWRTMFEAVDIDPRILGSETRLYAEAYSDPTYLFVAIVKALAASRRQVRRLYTDAIQIDYMEQSLMPSESERRDAFRSIQFVEINATGLPEERDLDLPLATGAKVEHAQNLEMMLGSMPELYEIGMTIFKDPKQRHMIAPDPRRLQSWTETYPYKAFTSISNNVQLKHLRRVKLEKLCTNAKALCGFLQPCSPTLMSLKLRHIHLLHEKTTNVHEAWRIFVEFMRDKCPAVEYLLLHDLSCNGSSIRLSQASSLASRRSFMNLGETRNGAMFGDLDLELVGRRDVSTRLSSLSDELTEGVRSFDYTMDENIWYTDTSDEDW